MEINMIEDKYGKKYYTPKECGYKIKKISNGGIDLTDSEVHRLMMSYNKLEGIKYHKINHKKCYRVDTFDRMISGRMSKEFLTRAYNIYMSGFDIHDAPKVDDNNIETDMEKYSNFLINSKYQYESMIPKKIIISEKSLNKLFEGVEYSRNSDGTINTSINTSRRDSDNRMADTRVFGKKKNILNLRNNGRYKYVDDYNQKVNNYDYYNKVADYARNQFKGKAPNGSNAKTSETAFNKHLNYLKKSDTNIVYNGKRYRSMDSVYKNNIGIQKDSRGKEKFYLLDDDKNHLFTKIEDAKDEIDRKILDYKGIESWANIGAHRDEMYTDMMKNKIDRLSSLGDNDVAFRYDTLRLPEIGIKVISLFSMNDFNFSDTIKNGTFRQNGTTDNILGIDKSDRATVQTISPKSNKELKKIPTTYDNDSNIPTDVASNFSLNNVKDGHFKNQYGYNDKNYSSINQFLDKSIIYASTVLKKENFMPTYIISVPSSSKYNEYYCTNLSNKLGVPYIKDFFKRNVINVNFDRQQMLNDGFNASQVHDLETNVMKSKLSEIAYDLMIPVKVFVRKYENQLNQIGGSYGGYSSSDFIPFIGQYAYNSLMEYEENNDNFTAYVLNNFLSEAKISDNKNISDEQNKLIKRRLLNDLSILVKTIGKGSFVNMINSMSKIIGAHREKLIHGEKLNFLNKKFKITDIDKRYRKYLRNVYIVIDKYLNKDKSLLSRFTNPSTKFLIFDEDINSGGSLKLSADGLKYQLLVSKENELMKNGDFESNIDIEAQVNSLFINNTVCLVNASSNSGK